MITQLRALVISLILGVVLVSCQKEEEEPIILNPLPEGSSAYLEVHFNDSTYMLMEGIDSVYSSYSYQVPAEDNGGAKILGARLNNDSSLIEFNIGYVQLDLSRSELLRYLTRAEQDMAFGFYEDGILKMVDYGFLMELVELNSPLGGGVGYSTYKIEQPDDSYFRIGHYYRGQNGLSIWLEGSFNLRLSGKYQGEKISGNFLLDFPFCCWE